MITVADLVQKLSGVRKVGGGWSARCPAHEDRHASLSFDEKEDGKILLVCHAGCQFTDILKALDLNIKDAFPPSSAIHQTRIGEKKKPAEPAVPPLAPALVLGWQAALKADPSAWKHATEVLRFSPDAIERYALGLHVDRNGRRWLMYPYRAGGAWTYAKGRSIDGEKAFLREPRGQASHPYGLDQLEDGGTAIVVEGERDALAAWTLGLHQELGGESGAALVSLPDGAKPKPGASMVSALKSQRKVYLVTDADGPGDTAAAGLAEELGADRCVRVRLDEYKDLGDLLSQLGPEMGTDAALQAFRRADERGDDPTGARAMFRSALVRFTADELLRPPPAQEFILHPYIPARVVTTLAGPGGSSKTTLLTHLAVCRALGRPFFGCPPRRGRTVILTTEDGKNDYWRKLAALRAELGDHFDAKAVAENVILLDLAGIPVRLVESEKGNWIPTPVPDHLAAVLKSDAPGTDLVIMETVSRLVGGVETNESLSILVEAAQRLCRLSGVAVVLVSHVSQEAGRQGTADAYAPRGGSALGDNGRSTMVLTRINDNNKKEFAGELDLNKDTMERLLVLTHPKSNGAPSAKPLLLERVSTPFGPALRPAKVRPKDPAECLGRLVRQVMELSSGGTPVTRNRLRDYTLEIGVAKHMIDKLVNDALRAGFLSEQEKPGRGAGTMLVPTGKGN